MVVTRRHPIKSRRCQFCYENPLSLSSMTNMISEAITALKERTGSSSVAIRNYIEEKHCGKLPANFRKQLAVQLKKLTATGKLTKVKNSFKLPSARPANDAKPKAVKAKAPKTAAKPKASLKVKTNTVAKPKAKAKPAAAPAAASPKPRGRPPKTAKTSTKASPVKASKKAAPAAKKEKAAPATPKKTATPKKVAATAAPARKGAARKAKK